MNRADVEERYKWDLSPMFKSDADWEKSFKETKELIPAISGFQGRLGDKKSLLDCFRTLDKLNARMELLIVYAHCKRDEDTRLDKYNAMYGSVMSVYSEFSAQASFIEPELSALPESTLSGFIADPEMSDYDYMLGGILKAKPHILGSGEEKILALAGDFSSEFSNVFTMIDNADLEAPEIEADGKTVKLTHGMYGKLLQHPSQDVRGRAFKAYYGSYKKHINTLAANYNGEVKKNVFFGRVRKYSSFLEKVMEQEDVPEKVYKTLVSAVGSGLRAMHRYLAYRKRAMGLSELHMYDLHTSIIKGAELTLEFPDAQKTVCDALRVMGKDYSGRIEASFRERWIDVYETDNKRSGGYCTHACLAPHPYILLNYSKTTHDVFTLAHELGHALHSSYSAEAQPYSKANYRIFVAEVASTVNEMLLLDHLMKTVKDAGVQKYLLSYKLDMYRTTVFRQTMFSEFELFAHSSAEKGEPLTVESLSDFYYKLNQKYYGEAVEHDDDIKHEWARIPHFYRSFYVYKYATGLISAANLANRILSGGADAAEKYISFLKSGDSKSPYEILKDAGVDLCTPEPYNFAMSDFSATLEKLEGTR